MDWTKEYDTLDEIPEGSRDAFEEKDGKFVLIRALRADGLKSTLEKQKKDLADLKAFRKKFDGVELSDEQLGSLHDDLDELASLREMRDAGKLGGDDLEKRVKELADVRLEAERKKYEREKAKIERERDTLKESLDQTGGKLKTLSIERSARDLASKHKIAAHALDDVLFRVSADFDLDEEGAPAHKSGNGQTLEDWFDETVPNKPGWTFDPKAGGSGAQGGQGNGAQRVYRRAEFDKISQTSPVKAAEISAAVRKGEAQLVD